MDTTLHKVAFNNVSLALKVPSYLPWSLRARFVSVLSHPLEWLRPADRQKILNDVSFSARHGERIAILGRNGAGKTSLCRLITGQLMPTSGQVSVSAPVTGVFDLAAGVYPDLTGRENGRLLLHYIFPDKAARHPELLEEAIVFSGLGEWIDRPVRLYSAGMKTRLSLSLVTALPGEILILDEVFDGADEGFREKIRIRMNAIMEKVSLCFFVSHSRDQVEAICNRAFLLDGGRLVCDGTPSEAFREYDRILERGE